MGQLVLTTGTIIIIEITILIIFICMYISNFLALNSIRKFFNDYDYRYDKIKEILETYKSVKKNNQDL